MWENIDVNRHTETCLLRQRPAVAGAVRKSSGTSTYEISRLLSEEPSINFETLAAQTHSVSESHDDVRLLLQAVLMAIFVRYAFT